MLAGRRGWFGGSGSQRFGGNERCGRLFGSGFGRAGRHQNRSGRHRHIARVDRYRRANCRVVSRHDEEVDEPGTEHHDRGEAEAHRKDQAGDTVGAPRREDAVEPFEGAFAFGRGGSDSGSGNILGAQADTLGSGQAVEFGTIGRIVGIDLQRHRVPLDGILGLGLGFVDVAEQRVCGRRARIAAESLGAGRDCLVPLAAHSQQVGTGKQRTNRIFVRKLRPAIRGANIRFWRFDHNRHH